MRLEDQVCLFFFWCGLNGILDCLRLLRSEFALWALRRFRCRPSTRGNNWRRSRRRLTLSKLLLCHGRLSLGELLGTRNLHAYSRLSNLYPSPCTLWTSSSGRSDRVTKSTGSN
jgi:hypothetical protein